MASQLVPSVGRHTRLADSDSESDDPQNTLTLAKASDFCPKPYRLVARNQNITNIADISSLTALDYIDLTSNLLTSLDGIDHPRLKTLIVAKNKLTQLEQIYKASTIRILNASENLIPTLEWLPHTAFAPHLLTLVASWNRLHSLAGVTSLSSLQTLVISNNEIEDLTPVTNLKSLTKLSASKNVIRILPCLARLQHLVELRLAHNRISSLPAGTTAKLQILDMGHNRLSNVETLSTFAPGLLQVSFRENPVSQREDYRKYVEGLSERLEVIDGQRISGGRRKVRVNRIRKAVGFEIERDRKYARMPPERYLLNLTDQKLSGESPKESAEKQATGGVVDDEGVEAEEFMAMARAKSPHEREPSALTVKVHGRTSRENMKNTRRERKKARVMGAENFGNGGLSRW